MKDELLREYARLAVRRGVNLQKGQKLVIRAGVDSAFFVRLLVGEAYAVGARDVVVWWSDERIARERYLHADADVFDAAYPWQVLAFDQLSEEGAAFLSVLSSDPAAFVGVDPDRIRRFSVAYGKANEKFYARMMASRIPWSIVAIPCVPWAEKVFPGKTADEAKELLWDAIFRTVRIREGGDAVAEWAAHCDRLTEQAEKLNG
ncbi:MAG: aminopeptidase, partial [Clostridia bacterium]|nr:aminopeptidase [Clostridia bacterium]